jgi:hypothetical protein
MLHGDDVQQRRQSVSCGCGSDCLIGRTVGKRSPRGSSRRRHPCSSGPPSSAAVRKQGRAGQHRVISDCMHDCAFEETKTPRRHDECVMAISPSRHSGRRAR